MKFLLFAVLVIIQRILKIYVSNFTNVRNPKVIFQLNYIVMVGKHMEIIKKDLIVRTVLMRILLNAVVEII